MTKNGDVKKMVAETNAFLKSEEGQKELLKAVTKAEKISRKLDEQSRIDRRLLQEPTTI